MAMCELSGKKISFGHHVSHAKNRANRTWKPNVHKQRLLLDGQLVRVNVAARTLRTLYKAARMAAKAD